MDWQKKYIAFEKKGRRAFEGGSTQTVIVSRQTGRVLGHLWAWYNPSVVDEWNPKRNGYYGKEWKKVRPKGWRKCRNQARTLDWALDALSGW